jgi:hypothetical protein
MASKVNVNEIISKHKSTLLNGDGKLLKKDKMFFITYPLIIGIFLAIIIRIPNDGLVNIFAICLSIFIGLFLNLLILIISFAENKLSIKDKKNRAILLEQTFYNITYTIVASLIGLGFLFLANIDFFPTECTIDLDMIFNKINLTIKPIPINTIIGFVLYFLFYSVFSHIIMTLLMIIKRIFKLFKVEIEEINKSN